MTNHTLIISFRIPPPCPQCYFPFGLTEDGKPQAGGQPKLVLAGSRLSLTPPPHAPDPTAALVTLHYDWDLPPVRRGLLGVWPQCSEWDWAMWASEQVCWTQNEQ